MSADELWMPLQHELTWAPLHGADAPRAKDVPAARTLEDYNAARMREDLDAVTEIFTELYLEANPNMARVHGHA